SPTEFSPLSLHDALPIFVLLSISRYGYEVLRTAAQGRAQLPAPAIETMNPVGELSLFLHFVFFTSLAVLLANPPLAPGSPWVPRSEEHTSELQSRENLVC